MLSEILRGDFGSSSPAKTALEYVIEELSANGSKFLAFLSAETAKRCMTTLAMEIDTVKRAMQAQGVQLHAQAAILVPQHVSRGRGRRLWELAPVRRGADPHCCACAQVVHESELQERFAAQLRMQDALKRAGARTDVLDDALKATISEFAALGARVAELEARPFAAEIDWMQRAVRPISSIEPSP